MDHKKLIQAIGNFEFHPRLKGIILSTLNSFKSNFFTEQEILSVLESFVEIREEVQIHDLGQDSKALETVFYVLTKEFFRFKPSRSLFYKELRYDLEREKSSWRNFFFIGLFEFFMCNTNELEINEIFDKELNYFHEFFYNLVLVDISERHYESNTLLWYYDCKMWSRLGKDFSKFLKGKIQKCVENDDINEFLKIYVNLFDVFEANDLLELFSFGGINIVPFLLKNVTFDHFFYGDIYFYEFLREKPELRDCISDALLMIIPNYSVEEINDPLYVLGFFACLTEEHIQRLIQNPSVDFFTLLMKYRCTDGLEPDHMLKHFIAKKEIDFCQLCRDVIEENSYEKIYWFWDRLLLEVLKIEDMRNLLEDRSINFVESLLKANHICKYKDEVGINYRFPDTLKYNYGLRSLMVKQITQVIAKYEEESFVPLLAMRLFDFFSAPELLELLQDKDMDVVTKINGTIELHYDAIIDLNESFYRWKINFLKFLTKFRFPVSAQIDRAEPSESLVMSFAPSDEEVEGFYDSLYDNSDTELNGSMESVSIGGRAIPLRDGTLDLSGLNIYDLGSVKGLFGLKKIKVLSISNNFVVELPNELGNLTSLEHLIIENCPLTSIPESISNLSNLKKINFQSSNLSSLPESFGNLKSLKKLNLWNTNIWKIPNLICDLSSLEYLNFNPRRWSFSIKIPESILKCSSLKFLVLNSSTLKKPAPIIEELRRRGVKVTPY